MKTAEAVKVGIAEMEVVVAPNVIRTCGLGSCVGVVIYDSGKAVAGMAHVMLPHSSMARGELSMPPNTLIQRWKRFVSSSWPPEDGRACSKRSWPEGRKCSRFPQLAGT